MTARELSSRVITSKQIREAKALEDHLQRNLKPRVQGIAKYLKTRDHRFFNSVILGVFDALPEWIQLDLATVGEHLGIPEISSIEDTIGMLMFHGTEKIFAIDGQHRVEGIKEALKEANSNVGEDQYSVLLIAHEDDVFGKIRTRRLFCDINKNAVPVSEGDKVIIDEDDAAAIVTRRVYAAYRPFDGGNKIAVSERKEVLVEADEERFTSLLALYTVTKKLKKVFKKKKGTDERAVENVERYSRLVMAFFNFIIKRQPSLKKYLVDGGGELKEEREKNKNLLFRPVGLEILARVYAEFWNKRKLKILGEIIGLLSFENPGSPFEGILWVGGKIKAGAAEKTAAVDLALYLLGSLPKESEPHLLKRLQSITRNEEFALPPRVKV